MVLKDHDIPFSRSFEVHFQEVFKDFSLFFQTFFHDKMIINGWKMGGGGGGDFVRVFKLFWNICFIMIIILQSKTILIERGSGGPPPEKF